MPNHYHVIIVGSGVAGLATAELLCKHGLRVLIVDDNAHTGGQLLRKPPYSTGPGRRFEPDRLKRWGLDLSASLKQGTVQFLHNAQVLGIYPKRTLLVETWRGRVSEYRADTLVLATGARERYLPFKGWTLPGVFSTGAAQILMKSSGILPGEKTLIAGCGPLMIVLAAEILANGGKVMAVLDQSSLADKLKVVTAGTAIGPKLLEGAVYLMRLVAARVPIKQMVRIVEARGRQSLEAVVVARVDAHGHVRQGTETVYATDTLAVGYGFTPNIELPHQAGCRVNHAVGKGGWHVDVNASMETSLADIYAVGETTGIAGGGKSLIEGCLAAWYILLARGRVDRHTVETHTRPLVRQRRQQIRYGRFLNQLCLPHPVAHKDIPDETIICRCEEITMGDIRGQLAHGFTTMNGIKRSTRCGMGNCQGRTCGPILVDILSDFSRQPAQIVGCTSARAPVKTVTLGALAQMQKIPGDAVDAKNDE